MRRLTTLAVALAAAPALAATDGWKQLDGQPVPEIHADGWLNAESGVAGVADLRGKVLLLEFFATW